MLQAEQQVPTKERSAVWPDEFKIECALCLGDVPGGHGTFCCSPFRPLYFGEIDGELQHQ